MSLYMGKYRRICCHTRNPKKKGWYLAFYGKDDKCPTARYFDGKKWKAGRFPNMTEDDASFSHSYNDFWSTLPEGWKE